MKIYVNNFNNPEILEWWMLYHYNYYRRIKVTQECRRFVQDKAKQNKFGFKLRGRRNNSYMNAWNLERVSTRTSMKSWKALVKCRKQYEKKYLLRKVVVEFK